LKLSYLASSSAIAVSCAPYVLKRKKENSSGIDFRSENNAKLQVVQSSRNKVYFRYNAVKRSSVYCFTYSALPAAKKMDLFPQISFSFAVSSLQYIT
jgi:hypothetical protein